MVREHTVADNPAGPASNKEASLGAAAASPLDVAIIGAGIAGLYCGYHLGQERMSFLVAEETDHLGGRIWTTRILENGDPLKDNANAIDTVASGTSPNRVEFCAEFGPMRLELDLQHELDSLLRNDLGFKDEDFEPFPPYDSPVNTHDPKYELKGEEIEQKNPFDLLVLGVVRVMAKIRINNPKASPRAASFNAKITEILAELSRTMLVNPHDWQKPFTAWVQRLDEQDYQNLREFAVFDDGTKDGTPLWNFGFWNLLSEVLSHHAVMKIRDLGTFYHLIPENPNAVEWLIFWLRGLRTRDDMVGIRGGMQRITEKIVARIGAGKIKTGHKLVRLSRSSGNLIELTFQNGNVWYARRVILALPKAPLEELARENKMQFYNEFHDDLDCVFSFPMLKLFLVVKEKFWEIDTARTNKYATVIPARELHYKSSVFQESKKGLVLLYTDRPASTFWANYVKKLGAQNAPELGGPGDNPRLINKTIQYLKEHGVTNVSSSDIPFYGIRDWGRKPYDGANHSWRPERKSWEVLRRLSGFRLGSVTHDGKPGCDVHVCGEAYSDYHGFIEGALRSAAHVLHRIDTNKFPLTPTEWLCDGSCNHPAASQTP